MKMRVMTALLLASAALRVSSGVAGRLAGCADPSMLAKALGKLQHSDWRNISVTRLQATWPWELRGLDCDSNSCSSVESKGRIISGRYECSEIFFFDVGRSADGTPSSRLNNLVIHWSTERRREATETARLLAEAVGLPSAEVAILGRESRQAFDWKGPGEGVLSGMIVEVMRAGDVWTVSLNLSHFEK